MPETFAKKNIYDNKGVLLLAKGQKITEEVIERLKRARISVDKCQENSDLSQSLRISHSVNEIREKLNIKNESVLEYPTNILNRIIFESKSEAWWIFVNALSNYLDWVYTHSIDVAIISLIIAMELKYTQEKLWNIGLGAFLHDVGKLLLPKRIIEKPGTLDEQELYLVRQHCELGISSVGQLGIPKECMDIILKHHERLDGSGYPNGLRADEISLDVRIVMIADVVDAITSYRTYKSAQNLNEAIESLKMKKDMYPKEIVLVLEKIMNQR